MFRKKDKNNKIKRKKYERRPQDLHGSEWKMEKKPWKERERAKEGKNNKNGKRKRKSDEAMIAVFFNNFLFFIYLTLCM